MRNKVLYVTTFSKRGYKEYGQRFLKTFKDNIDEPLFLVLDDEADVVESWPGLTILKNDFADKIGKTYGTFEPSSNYRFAPNRFCFKTSAVETALNKVVGHEFDFLIWLDADSVIKADDLTDYLLKLAPEEQEVASFFDRNQSYGYSETGIIIFNLNSSKVHTFIKEWNAPFVDGDIFQYAEWHDAFFFSHLVRSMPPKSFKYLCSEYKLKSSHPIFELKPLRDRIEHLKGDTRKKLGFSPEKYKIPTAIFSRFLNRGVN